MWHRRVNDIDDPMGWVGPQLWEKGAVCWYCDYDDTANSGINDEWVMSSFSALGPQLSVDGTPWTQYWFAYNGKRYWSNGSLFLWWSGTQWIISSTLGARIAEEWDDSDNDPANHEYVGNPWWSKEETPADIEGDYEARGSGRGTTEGAYEGTAKTVTVEVVGYKRTTAGDTGPAGLYENNHQMGVEGYLDGDLIEYAQSVNLQSGNYIYATNAASPKADITYNTTLTKWVMGTAGSGVWYLGDGEPDVDTPRTFECKTWTDQNDTLYPRSVEQDANAKWVYGNIHYDNDNTVWIIGTYESASGWWEGSEPQDGSSVTFAAQKTAEGTYPNGSEDMAPADLIVERATPATLTITFDEMKLGDEDWTVLTAQIGLWV